MILELLLTLMAGVPAPMPEGDTLSIVVPSVVVGQRQTTSLGKVASSFSYLGESVVESRGLGSPKTLSGVVPSLHIADYGSSMTSSIYLRGFGSRMDNPVMGLYIDDIPVLDKNSYESQMGDILSVVLLRGPQGTLYGRNSLCGILSVKTLSPDSATGGRAFLEGGNYGRFSGGVSLVGDRSAFSLNLRHQGGYFRNDFDGKKADSGDYLSARYRLFGTGGTFKENNLSVSILDEGGFAYGRLVDGKVLPSNHNDKNGYRRFSIIDGVKLGWETDRLELSGIFSYQGLFDRMDMDQDYLPVSYFTLRQSQRSSALTGEVIARPREHPSWWSPTFGAALFGKLNYMDAPVTFKRDGIDALILANANANIPSSLGEVQIEEQSFPISSRFWIGTWNAALYHESVFTIGRWTLSAGLRLDYEGGAMRYNSKADINYRFYPIMQQYKPFSTRYKGNTDVHSVVLLPKLSAMYTLSSWPRNASLYANISRGHMGGGFNTQIFSDILQNLMMKGMMEDLGVHIDTGGVDVDASSTRYKSEKAWSFEVGGRFSTSSFRGELSAFYMYCGNLQMTVFPPGKSTGRMMTNAGRAASAGVEAEAQYSWNGLGLSFSGSLTNAEFRRYETSGVDYKGRKVPYSPRGNMYLGADYTFSLGTDGSLSLGADLRGTGKIYWNEDNTLSEDPYALVGTYATLTLGRTRVYLRGDNILDTKYNTFYFKSVGNEFMQISRPCTFTLGISYAIGRTRQKTILP